ncbi:MAG TPA: flagellar type III secretion system pore protein FliP [bacterium]|nr:flagellar type III secretion system pore protein FliP [bacterium]HOL93495.1 flagellar type III secretion system pore protein FliP [bacterium]HPP00894.1 flagellar type III secretion system pore protein FliP [bacterium]HXK92548.1 flagellar type III secretion system pore protein FliP [bacterium]
MPRKLHVWLFGLGMWIGGASPLAYGQEGQPLVSRLGIDPITGPHPQDVSVTLQILFLLTILSLLPSIAVMTTSFIRISIVLGLVRRAIGTQQTPSNEVIVGLSLFMTFFIMTPVFEEINRTAIQPYLNQELQGLHPGEIDAYGKPVTEYLPPFYVMLQRALIPLRNFMWGQIGVEGANDVAVFMSMARMEKPDSPEDVPTHVLIPAFMISELKKAFMMGFMIFIPFLILDLVTSSVLISMGMFQLPPAFISLPFKILLFVLVDGWSVLARALGTSFYQNMAG